MKRLLLIVLPLLLIFGCSSPEPINYEEMLNERDGIFYTKDTNEPYSGLVFSLYGVGKEIRTIKWDYYENGQKESELIYKDKKLIKSMYWYENGKKMNEGTWKNGENISFKRWNEDGSVKE